MVFLAIVYFACHGRFYFRKRDSSSFKARSSYTFHGRVTENPHSFVLKTVKRSPNPASWFTCCKRCRLRRDKITLNTICKTISSYNLRLLYLLQLLSKINQPLQNIVKGLQHCRRSYN